jgi:prepilin-type N-terminal cleavage/methylation domain-containing protein
MRPRPSEEGFTLPELLISVSILAIIVAPLTMSFILGCGSWAARTRFTDSAA